MPEESFKCIKCDGKMAKGFICDKSENGKFITEWVEGEPVKVELFGIVGSNLDISGRRRFTVRSLRCEQCGFLESYAV